MIRLISVLISVLMMIFCLSSSENSIVNNAYPDVQVVGAMKRVMWKGELGARINLDTLSDRSNLYGLGPVSYLRGELLINDGRSFISKVTTDSTMVVEESYDIEAPFFVYTRVNEWANEELPVEIKTIQQLENYLNDKTKHWKRPFVFKLKGKISKSTIHIQNLPEGTKVKSPKEAHQGQIKYQLQNTEVDIIGFFSIEHHGIFTHHDSNVHMHLITADKSKMGHLDEVQMDKMVLFLPKN